MSAPAYRGDAKRLGRAIRAVRIICGWTQSDLAKRLRVSTSYVCMVERGSRALEVRGRARFARVLGISRASLDREYGACPRCGGSGRLKVSK